MHFVTAPGKFLGENMGLILGTTLLGFPVSGQYDSNLFHFYYSVTERC
jgi:hypothetical protein